MEKITPAGSLASRPRNRRRSRHSDHRPVLRQTTRSATPSLKRFCAFPASWKCWPRARTRSASNCAAACRSTCACFRRTPSAQPCNTSPAPRTTTSRLRQRALKMGYTLNEYGLVAPGRRTSASPARPKKKSTKLEARLHSARRCARTAAKSKLAPKHKLPHLITIKDIRGDVHMHTVETDGKCTIEEMAAGSARTRLQVHRHHRPLQEPGLRQRTRRQARRRAHRAHSRGQRADRWHHDLGRHRSRHPGRRRTRPLRLGAGADGRGHRQRALRTSTRNRSR